MTDNEIQEVNPTPENGQTPEQTPKKKKRVAMPRVFKRIIQITAIVLASVLVLGLGMFGWPGQTQDGFTGLMPILFRNSTAMTVSDTDIPVYEFNFNYMTEVQYFMQNNASYLEQLGLSGGALDKLPCYYDETITWQEYFITETIQTISTQVALYKRAAELGITLSPENQANIDSFVNTTLADRAKENDLTAAQFVKKLFGRTVTLDNIRKSLERAYIAQQVNQYLTVNASYTDEERQAYVDEQKADFATVNFNIFTFTPESTDPEDIVAAKDLAKEFLKGVTDSASFDKQALAYAKEEDKEKYSVAGASMTKNAYKKSIAVTDVNTWLFSEERKTGDTTVIYNSDAGLVYALRYESAGLDHSPSFDIRSISFTIPEDDKDGVKTTQKAADLVAQWIADGQTEEGFAEMAKQNSEDISTKDDGGLAKKVVAGQMVDVAFAWCTQDGRKAGDYSVLAAGDAVYIMYISALNEETWRVLADRGIAQDKIADEVSEELQSAVASVTWLGNYLLTK